MTSVLAPSSARPSLAVKSSVLLPPAVKEGWLHKVGGNVKTWKGRYFRLYGEEIQYFESESTTQPKGSIPIKGSRLSVYHADLTPDHPYSFSITPQSSGRHYYIAAATHTERMEWVGALHPLCRVALKAQVSSLREGYLTKQGGRVKTWKKRWVILNEKQMVYYKDVKDVKQVAGGDGGGGIDALDLSGGFEVESEKGGKEGEWVFLVSPQVGAGGRVYKFASQTEADREGWVKTLKDIKKRHDTQQMNIRF